MPHTNIQRQIASERECRSLANTDRSTTTRRTGNPHWEHGTKPPDSLSEACAVPVWSPACGPKRGTERTSADSWRTYLPSLLLGRAGRPKMGPQISPTNAVRMRPHLYDQPGLGAPKGRPTRAADDHEHTAETPPALFTAHTQAGARALEPSHETRASTVRSHVPCSHKKE